MDLRRSPMATKRYKRDLKELERRRRKGMQLLRRGVSQAEVAHRLCVSRQAVSTWARAQAQTTGPSGGTRCDAEETTGQAAGSRRGGLRVSHRTVDARPRGRADPARFWRGLRPRQRMVDSEVAGFLEPTSHRAGDPARQTGDPGMEGQALARTQKKPGGKAGPSSSSTNRD